MDKIKSGRKLAKFRKEKGLTQREMAEAMKIATITLSQKEQGLISLTTKDLINIKKHFKVNIDFLIS